MSDAISNYGRLAQSNASLRNALDKLDNKSATTQNKIVAQPSEKLSTGEDQVSLSNVVQKAMAQPDLDRAKVEAVKQAIKGGNYPLNPRLIAEKFVSLERVIAQ